MEARSNVRQLSTDGNSPSQAPLTPRHGVLTLFGYGIHVKLDRGHLVVEDGIGPLRRVARLPRVGHGLRRLIVIGSDGMVSLAAIRWLADQKAAFLMLNRNGSVLVATGPAGPRDGRLRRAQALAQVSTLGLTLARDLVARKLTGQESNVRRVFKEASALDAIASARERLASAATIADLRLIESHAALAYWTCWRKLHVLFPKTDLEKVPDHWRVFGARISPVTGSPRVAVNPPNAMLNYLYAVLESEARLAASALGLDPALGFMHMDTNARDSLAADLMEPIRPIVDAYVLDWLIDQPLRREWFYEERSGACRLMGRFVERLSTTARTWAQAVAPIAERVASELWTTIRKPRQNRGPATRLTQQHRREAKGTVPRPVQRAQSPPKLCRLCGKPIPRGGNHCAACWAACGNERMLTVAAKGRTFAYSSDAQARRRATRKRNADAERRWNPSDQPDWLTERFYVEKVQPNLMTLSAPRLASALNVSIPYAVKIRFGRRQPHPRHWLVLAGLVGVIGESTRR
jgi:CRISPR-associated endonuclease Cas1